MKQKLRVFLTLLLCAVASVGWAEEKSVTFVPTDFGLNETVSFDFTKDGIKIEVEGSTTTSDEIRIYKNKTITISSSTATITKIVFNCTANGTTKYGPGCFASQEGYSYEGKVGTWEGSASSVVFTASSNQVRATSIVVTYTTGSGSSLEDNNLSLSPISLEFDLYDDASAKTISYTTSSTGAVTVSASEYLTTEVNETNKTITVTPKSSVTPSAQTITVSQAADDTYAAGYATFTVTIDDSTPVTATNWKETDLTNIEDGDIFVIVGNNGNNFALANDKGTASAPTAVAVTVNGNYITGNVADNIKWNVSGNATDGYTFYPNGNTTAWLYTTNTNNGVRVGTNDNKTFTIDNGYLKNSGTSRYVGIYDSQDWRCYTSYTTANIANQTFKFYKYIGAPEPTISANNVEIAYNVTSGSIGYTIGNPADGTLTATEDADWLTIGTITSDEVPFTVTPNTSNAPRTANVTLTYTYGESIVSKNVTVTQAAAPATLMTIAEVRVQSLGSNVKTSGIVTSVNGQNVYMQDATAAIVVYGENSLTKGDNITVEGKLATFNGLLEIQNAIVTVNSQGNTVEPVVKTIAEINTDDGGDKALQAMLVKIENATVTAISGDNTTISQGDNSIVVYKITGAEYGVDDILTLTGNVGYHNKAQIVNATDITVQDAEQKYTVNIGTLTHVTSIDLWDGDMEDIADGSEVTPGTLVYAKPNVETGYTLKTITAVDAENNDITLSENNGAWSFIMPNSSVTINATATSSTPATGDKYVKVTSTNDITDGQYLIVYEDGSVAFNGGLETLDAASNTIEVEINDFEIRSTDATATAEFTIASIEEGYSVKCAGGKYIGATSYANSLVTSDNPIVNTITITEGDANFVVTTSGGDVTLRYNNASNQNRFRYFKSGQQAIQLYKKVSDTPQPETIEVTIGKNATGADGAYYSSVYYSDKALEVPEGIECLTYKVVDGVLTVSKTYSAGDVIPADEAVVIKASASGTVTFPVTTATADKDTNSQLKGVDDATTISGGTNYKFYKLTLNSAGAAGTAGFYWDKNSNNGSQINAAAHKCYLQVDADQVGAKSFVFGDETDGIGQVEIDQTSNAGIYNLSGQRVNKTQKGIYIVNGKKVVIR